MTRYDWCDFHWVVGIITFQRPLWEHFHKFYIWFLIYPKQKKIKKILVLWMAELGFLARFDPFWLKISHFCCLFPNTYPDSHYLHSVSWPCFGPTSLTLFLPTLFGKRGIFTRSPWPWAFCPLSCYFPCSIPFSLCKSSIYERESVPLSLSPLHLD